MHSREATAYLAQRNARIAEQGAVIDGAFMALGCDSYVKTIYIGYEIEGQMIAALYCHTNHIELALALAEDDPNPILKDATHLTWRTLPVLVEVRSDDEVAIAVDLAGQAFGRVKGGVHNVERDNEHFVRSRRERRERGA